MTQLFQLVLDDQQDQKTNIPKMYSPPSGKSQYNLDHSMTASFNPNSSFYEARKPSLRRRSEVTESSDYKIRSFKKIELPRSTSIAKQATNDNDFKYFRHKLPALESTNGYRGQTMSVKKPKVPKNEYSPCTYSVTPLLNNGILKDLGS